MQFSMFVLVLNKKKYVCNESARKYFKKRFLYIMQGWHSTISIFTDKNRKPAREVEVSSQIS